MSVTIKSANLKYKNQQGEYVGVNSISDNSTAEQLAAIASAGSTQLSTIGTAGWTQINAIEDKGAETLASIPDDYTTLSENVTELKSAIDSINDSIFEQYNLSIKQTDKLNISPSTGYWNLNNNCSAYYFEIPEYAKALYIHSNLLNGSVFALLSASDTHTHNDLPVYATGSGRTFIEAGERLQIFMGS